MGLGGNYLKPEVAAKQFHPRNAYRSPASRGVVPKTLLPEFNKLAYKLWDAKFDLEDAKKDSLDAENEGQDPASIVDDGDLDDKEGLMLPAAIVKYKEQMKEYRTSLEAIPKLFVDKGLLSGNADVSLDDVIPEKVIKGV